MSPTAPLVLVQDVWKSYGQLDVLRGIDLTVRAGEVLCLLGPSGSGKSTLLRCINHLTQIDRGLILVNGELVGYAYHDEGLVPLPERKAIIRRRAIGMVFQSFNLFPHMTALRNVMEAPIATGQVKKKEAAELAREMLARVGLSDKCDAYPGQLSGGQQQRVAIARALALKPKLMMFDEATSALDPELVRDVLDVMRGLSEEGMTMIVVTHEMGFAREAASMVGFMDNGKLIELAPPEQFFTDPASPRTKDFLHRVL
jgi:polar amino acid transport system ATP-binding protein